MADATASPTLTDSAAHGGSHSRNHHAPVTPGKVAMWLFLATEVMFFTGLIGSYIVLRSGSPSTSYSNLYPPTTSIKEVEHTYGVLLKSVRVESRGGRAAHPRGEARPRRERGCARSSRRPARERSSTA